jgi:L-fuconate dehydratase
MALRIVDLVTHDVRFPTSKNLDGSDAMNVGDYSAAYVVLKTDEGLEGHGLTFTNGRGNELCVAAVEAQRRNVVGLTLEGIRADMVGFLRGLTQDKQLRWVGPEKGVLHMATGAIVNAVWDLWAKSEARPLWQLVANLTPEETVRCLDFSYITDALTPDEALAILKRQAPTKALREAEMRKNGYPGYTTSTGWLGYPDEKVRRLVKEARGQGWEHFKMKVGKDLAADRRRAALMRQEMGPTGKLMMDANQCWDVGEAIEHMKGMTEFDPWWIEEPTCPDDVLGHAAIARAVAPIGVATGESCQNRIVFKQLLQANAIAFCQVDSCRMAGVNEVLAVMLMAQKFAVPVCPHTGGVGLCEYAQHLSLIDYICISGSLDRRMLEYVDHLHEHFVDPVRTRNGRYLAPEAPGYSIAMKPESIVDYEYPGGRTWRA